MNGGGVAKLRGVGVSRAGSQAFVCQHPMPDRYQAGAARQAVGAGPLWRATVLTDLLQVTLAGQLIGKLQLIIK